MVNKASNKVIGQYPFFAIDDKYAANARKATEAEWKLLARYNKTKVMVDDAGIDEDY